MKLLWRKAIAFSNMWEPELDGLFVSIAEKERFYFNARSSICFCEDPSLEVAEIQTIGSVPVPSLPRKWRILTNENDVVLAIDAKHGLQLEQGSWINLSQKLERKYAQYFQREYIKESFSFQEFTIRQRGNCGYECRKKDEMLWRFAGKGYLYTDIIRWNNRVFFGTGGRGGYFYILDIDNGQVITEIKTGGTRYFIQVANTIYVMTNSDDSGHAELICINLVDGTISESLSLPGVATVNSKLQLLNDKLHTVTFEYSANRLVQATWNCIELYIN